VHPGNQPEDDKEHHQAAEAHAEEEQDAVFHGSLPPVMGLLFSGPSGQCRDRVCPLLDEREDGVTLVGGDPDLVAGEGQVVDLPGRVVAPDRDGIGLPVGKVDRVATHRGGDLGIGEELGLDGRECRRRRCTDADGPHGGGLVVFVCDTGAVTLPGLCDRGHRDSPDLVGRAAQRVGGDEGVDDGVDGCCVCERCTQGAGRTLRDALLDKVCHVADTPVSTDLPGFLVDTQYIKEGEYMGVTVSWQKSLNKQ